MNTSSLRLQCSIQFSSQRLTSSSAS
jgi:hypothetical protein